MNSVPLKEVLVFGGTTEGRLMVEWLSERGTALVTASALTEYGGSLTRGLQGVTSLAGRLDAEGMQELMRAHDYACVVDATHPFATDVSSSIVQAAHACRLPVLRIVREDPGEGAWIDVADAQSAACVLGALEGRILFTTGSKDLPLYAREVPGFLERAFVRVLPIEQSIAATEQLGLPASHVVAMQGPFSADFNRALIRELNIAILVTKATGATGGFWQKVEAAQACGTQLVVISRPAEAGGLSLEEAKRELEEVYGL